VRPTAGCAGSATRRLVEADSVDGHAESRRPSKTDQDKEETVYDMYPDWGPASHQPENPLSQEAIQASLDLRDNGGQRPDDN
jgi:hypothetical protein